MLKLNLNDLTKNMQDIKISSVEETNNKDIAIIGISVKLPMAGSLNEFWQNLKNGKNCIVELPDSRKEEADKFLRFKRENPKNIKYKKGSYLERLDEFDYKFFNISPREASLIDPNQRIFLQTVLHTIDDAGYSSEKIKGSRTGVYFGYVSDSAYQRLIAEVEPSAIGISIPGNMASIIPGRVSYILDLKGPSIMIDTACSSSLVAVHTACTAIRNGDCDMAIVGSGKMNLLPMEDNNMLGIESKDYTCKAFDDSSEGTCMGEGYMAIMLKPASKAIKDKDNIYAIIKGSAVNQDGTSMGLTAPNSLAQADVIDRAWKDAEVEPETISYIETHGTGTKLGDPIEVDGITKAFRKYTDRKQFCGIGSVKTNLGHLDSAAGLVGLIKAVLSLKHQMIPPSINFIKPNKNIDFENSPVFVNHKLNKWNSNNSPRRCGVSAFGLSGTNCHIILEEANVSKTIKNSSEEGHLFAISAKSEEALKQLVEEYHVMLNEGFVNTLGDLCYTANTGRVHYSNRIIFIVKDLEELKIRMQMLLNSVNINGEKGIHRGEFKIVNSIKENGSNIEITEDEQKGLTKAADEKIKEYKKCKKSSKDSLLILNELCKLYIKGASINWEEFYLQDNYNRISLPVYPFEKTSCWVKIPEIAYENVEHNKDNYTIVDTNKNKSEIILLGRDNNDYTETEKQVAQVWGEVLGFDEIDINQDLYELGGDSILAMDIANGLSSNLGEEIKVSHVMRNLTVKDFAQFFDKEIAKKIDINQNTTQLSPIVKKEHYSLSAAQKRIYMLDQLSDTGVSYNMPVAVVIEGDIDRVFVENIFNELVHRHEALRTSFKSIYGEAIQIIHDIVDFKMDYIETNEDELANVVDGLIKPFDISKAPLFRAALIKISDKKHLLFYDVYHIVADGVSLAILLSEFKCLYQSKELPLLSYQYKDFAEYHNKLLRTDEIKKQERYWLDKYSGDITNLDMPLDFKRPDVQVFTGNTIEFVLESKLVSNINEFAQKQKITLNSFLLSTYSLLIGMYSNQDNIVVGSLVAGRSNDRFKNVIGMFVNFLPMKFDIDLQKDFINYLNSSNNMILEGFENQDYPFDLLVENLYSKIDRSRNPLFDTVFIFHNELKSQDSFEIDGLLFKNYKLETNTSKLDFKIDAYITKDGSVKCVLEYNTSLFKEESMQAFGKHYINLIEHGVSNPERMLNEIEVITDEEKRSIEEKRIINSSSKDTISLVVSATFTSEPINDYITWWCKQAGIEVDVEFAPYNQVFQQLLDSGSLLAKNKDLNLLLVRPEDWIRNDNTSEAEKYAKLEEYFERLVNILKGYNSQAPCFFGVFPVSTHLSLSNGMMSYIDNMNKRWADALKDCDNIHVVDFTGLNTMYSINEVFDIYKDREGHLPFSDEYYAAMGTFIARKICSYKKPQFKVVVLDCDNTLWNGVCGEDGALGVCVDANFAAIQNFMLEKYNSGMLLTICSKNNEQDVWEVFSKNKNMILKKEHFVGWKINWNSKAENIKELAQELNLGLDSFIFIDDNPVECAMVMEECPSVLTLQIPEDTNSIPAFLKHIWAFDIFKVTEEDKNRTKLYTTEKKRKEIQESNISLDDFIKSLELKVSMNQMDESQSERVSQLTMRTNQFNLSTIRRSKGEILDLTKAGNARIWAIEVADKFGDYGLVGVVITQEKEKSLFIDTFLLSCRVLGRGVEYAIISMVGKYARSMGVEYIEAKFYPTQKNKPLYEFILNSGWILTEKSDNESNQYSIYRLDTKNILESTDMIDCYFMSSFDKTYSKSNEADKEKKPSYPLHHIAVAVKDIEASKEEYMKNGYKCGDLVHDTLQNAYLIMCTKTGNDAVELVSPVNSESPINRIIEENGSIPYHLCYVVDNCKKYLDGLNLAGIEYEIISDEKEAILFNNDKVTFISVKDFGLIELLESKDNSIKDYGSISANSSVLQIITRDIERPVKFLAYMGYVQEKSIQDISKKIRTITFYKLGEGRIEVIIPIDESSIEYKFLKRNGAHPYKLGTSVEESITEHAGMLLDDNSWKVMLPKDDKFFHQFYLVALSNYTANTLMTLPVYEANVSKDLKLEYEAPSNEIEEKLVSIWQQVLAIEKIGVNNSFFELGGHSLKATVLISQICKEFNVDITLTDLFKAATIRKLAKLISGANTSTLGEIEPLENKDYYALSAAQKRVYLIHQLNSNDTSYNIPAAVLIEGQIDRQRFEDVFNKIIQRHEILRTSFATIEGNPVQIVHKSNNFKLKYIEAKDSELENVIASLVKPFDLAKAPLIRACLIKIAKDKHILYYEMHHIVADGVSYALLMNEFMMFYHSKELPLPSIQYKDYAAWHNGLMESEVMKKQEKFWLDKYATKTPVLDFPMDYQRPEVQIFTGSKIEFKLDKSIVENLNKIAKNQETTLNTIMFSLYALMLHKYSEQEEIVVGSLVAGRRHASTNNIIGMFVNFLPIKFSFSGENTIMDFFNVSSKAVLEAYENQDFPFDILVEKVITKVDRSRNPLFDTAFIFHNEFDGIGDIEIDSLKFSNYELNTKTSTLDFKMDVYPLKNEELRCVIEYNTSLLKEESIKSFAMYFRVLLEKAIDEPKQILGRLELFSQEQMNDMIGKRELNQKDQDIQVELIPYQAPVSEMEKELVSIWQMLFRKEKIGINDVFYELGGNSLKAVSLISNIYKRLNVELSVLDVFNMPTISKLAKFVESSTTKGYYEIPKAVNKPFYTLSSAQKRLYMVQQFDVDSTVYNEPAIVQIEGVIDRNRLETAFEQLLNRHESLRTAFEVIDDVPVQKIYDNIKFNITYTKASQEGLQEAVKKAIGCFDLTKPPLINVSLISVSNENHVLVCNMHHIITDGVSINVLVREFIKLYNNEKLAELILQYKDFSEWQNEVFKTGMIKEQEEYWLNKFSGNIPVLNMPTDYPRPQMQSFEGDTYKYDISNECVEQLDILVKETGATLYMLLLAAFNVLLSKYTGQEDIVVGSPIAGRPHPELQNIIGMFVNTLAMRNQPQGNKTFIEFLHDVKANSLNAYKNQDLQFEQLVKKLGIDKDASRNPLFDVVFVLQQNDIPQIQIDGLSFKRYNIQNNVSKFDMTLEVEVSESGIGLLFKYCTKLYSNKTIEKIASDYLEIIKVIVEDRNIQLKDILLNKDYIKRDRAIKEEISFDF